MTTAVTPRPATRHECIHARNVGGSHDQGTGKPARKRCSGCGGVFMISRGWYGLFLHSSVTGRAAYRVGEALSLHRTESGADNAAEGHVRPLSQLAVRWVAED